MLESGTDEILSRVHAALLEAGVDPSALRALNASVSLSDDLGVDSFQLTRVASHLEEAYELRFSLVDWVIGEEDETGAAYTVGSLVTFIQAQLQAERLPLGNHPE